MNFREEQKQRTEQIEQILRRFLPEAKGEQRLIMEAMEYSLLAGGKRLRPMLMWETYRLFGGKGSVVEPFMAAMEMIHTYSLVHDDLPAMDNDEYRRGRKTTHVVYGEDMGILAGDALLNYAYETAFAAFDMTCACGAPMQTRIAQALKILGRKTGIHGMLGGQGVDVENDGKPLTREMLDYIYENKTSALIECAMMIGAVLAGASKEETEKIEQAAGRIGIAFQIRDDILDVTGSTKELGKAVGSDEKNNKTTYVTLEGIEKAGEKVRILTEEAIGLLQELPGEKEFLTELLISLCTRRK